MTVVGDASSPPPVAGCLPTPVRAPEGGLRRDGAVERTPFTDAKVVFGVETHAGCNLPASAERLSREGYSARAAKRARELGKDRQIGMEPNPIQPTDAQRGKRPLVLETAELALDGGAATVQSGASRAESVDEAGPP